MKNLISAKHAGQLLLAGLILLFLFHVLVTLKIIPSDNIWGGQVSGTDPSLLYFELIAFAITGIFIFIILAKLDYIKIKKFRTLLNVGVWIIFIYFVLNTIGNFASGVTSEALIFGPITIVLSILALRLAIEK